MVFQFGEPIVYRRSEDVPYSYVGCPDEADMRQATAGRQARIYSPSSASLTRLPINPTVANWNEQVRRSMLGYLNA